MSDKDVEALTEAVTNAGAALERGETIYKNLKNVVSRMRIALVVAIIGVVLDLALSGLFAYVLNNQSNLNDGVEANRVQIAKNQAQIHKTICDLNTVFIKADTPAARERALDKTAYDASYHQIYTSRVELGCQPSIPEPVRPPG